MLIFVKFSKRISDVLVETLVNKIARRYVSINPLSMIHRIPGIPHESHYSNGPYFDHCGDSSPWTKMNRPGDVLMKLIES